MFGFFRILFVSIIFVENYVNKETDEHKSIFSTIDR